MSKYTVCYTVCPYCDNFFNVERVKPDWVNELNNHCFDIECPECEKIMEIAVEMQPIFEATEIKIYECNECHKEFRWYGDFAYVPDKFKGKGYSGKIKLCDECYWNLKHKDWENRMDITWADFVEKG
jgi:hypothetical protein